MQQKHKKVILVDLDGVLNSYGKGFAYEENFIPPPIQGAKEFLEELNKKFTVFIFTSRPCFLAKAWVMSNNLEHLVKEITNNKVPAYLHIDDRAICHNGNFSETMKNIDNFKVHWK